MVAGPSFAARLKRRAVILLVCGLVVATAGVTGCFLLTFPGVNIRRVGFSTGGYESPPRRVSGLLMTPENPVERPTPAVVFIHGYLMSKETYLAPARELARRGVVVLAIDLRGHGSTGGRSDQNYSEVNDALAAVDYLCTLPGIDGERIAATGHSRGGITSTRAGILQQDSRIKAVAAVYCSTGVEEALLKQYGPVDDFIGRIWPYLAVSHTFDVNSPSELKKRDFGDRITTDRPPDYLLVIGSKDSLATIAQEEKIVEAATGLDEIVPGKTYGSFEDGTARKLVVTKDTHLSEAYSPEVWSAVYSWIFEAFGLKRPAPAGAAPLRRYLFQGMVLLGCILFATGMACGGRSLFGEPAEKWSPDITPGRTRQYGEVAALCVLCYLAASLASLPLAGALHVRAFVPFSFLPFILGPDLMSGVAAGQVLVLLLAFPLLALLARRWNLTPARGWQSPAAELRRAFRRRPTSARGDSRAGGRPPFMGPAATAFISIVPFSAFVALYAPAAYALYLTRGVPISIGGFFTLACVLAAYFYVSGRLFHDFALPRWGSLDSRGKRVTYVLAEAATRGIGFGLAFVPVAAGPFIPLGGLLSGRTVPLVPTMALAGFAIFIPVSAITLAFRRRGYGVVSSSVLMALVIAWIFSTQVAVRFF